MDLQDATIQALMGLDKLEEVYENKISKRKEKKEEKVLKESELSDMFAELPKEQDPAVEDAEKNTTGIVDGVLIITDPDVNSDEYEELISKANDIIEGTPEGELPFLKDYIGQYVQICPICGNTFVTKTLLGEGDACPVCTDTPTNFVTVGKIGDDEEETEETENNTETFETEKEKEEVEEPEETKETEEEI